MESWDEVNPGDVITVTRPWYRNAYKLRIERVEIFATGAKNAFVYGERLTMAGTPSRRRGPRGADGRKEPRKLHLVNIEHVTK
jgi:hypothetical protein